MRSATNFCAMETTSKCLKEGDHTTLAKHYHHLSKSALNGALPEDHAIYVYISVKVVDVNEIKLVD